MEYAVKHRTLRGTESLRWLLLVLPLYFYIVVAWLIRPLSSNDIALAYVVPLFFGVGILVFSVPRAELVAMLRRVRVELALTLFMAALSILSIVNSGELFLSFRILFPSILPTLLFFHLMALRKLSPETVERIPRLFLLAGLLLACLPPFLSLGFPAFDRYLVPSYRLRGFFDHEAQLSVMIAVLVPLTISEIAIAQDRVKRWLWIAVLAILFYTLIQVGSKTALFITIGYAWLFYLITHARVRSAIHNLMIFSVIAILMISLVLFGRDWVTAIDPILGQKIDDIFSGGVENYATIETRMEIWREAWRQGMSHWLIGYGAGMPVLDESHAHNLVLEYFRGIGVFGMLAIVLLCLKILWRAAAKTMSVLAGQASPHHLRVLACYVAGVVFVLGNLLSNSWGPGIVSALWLTYLPAVMCEDRTNGRSARRLPS